VLSVTVLIRSAVLALTMKPFQERWNWRQVVIKRFFTITKCQPSLNWLIILDCRRLNSEKSNAIDFNHVTAARSDTISQAELLRLVELAKLKKLKSLTEANFVATYKLVKRDEFADFIDSKTDTVSSGEFMDAVRHRYPPPSSDQGSKWSKVYFDALRNVASHDIHGLGAISVDRLFSGVLTRLYSGDQDLKNYVRPAKEGKEGKSKRNQDLDPIDDEDKLADMLLPKLAAASREEGDEGFLSRSKFIEVMKANVGVMKK